MTNSCPLQAERSVWKFFGLAEHSIEQKDIAYVYALPIQMLCRDFVLTKSRLPPALLSIPFRLKTTFMPTFYIR